MDVRVCSWRIFGLMQSAGCKTAGGGGGGGELSVKGGGRGGGANWLYFLLHFAVSLQLV